MEKLESSVQEVRLFFPVVTYRNVGLNTAKELVNHF